jgi:nitrite reductase/ring-hydroxylating ferredoxin subunit
MDPLLPRDPAGWYLLAPSEELRRGAVTSRRFMGDEIIVYRTGDGEPRASSAFCPHLGAHLGHSGRVVGEELRCAFHGFCFDGQGACVKTPYGTRPPPKARLRAIPVREKHGVVLGWHDPLGRAPTWEVADLDTRGWSPLRWHHFRLRGHPQETTENSVDVGHLSELHGYHDVEVLSAPVADGPHLHARYAITRLVGIRPLAVPLQAEFEVHAHGLGYSLVDVRVPRYRLHDRQLVCATPAGEGEIDLRIALSVEEPAVRTPLRPIVRSVADLIARFMLRLYVADVSRDVAVWRHKRYLGAPALAAGDGPVGLYRKWAAQFYPALATG